MRAAVLVAGCSALLSACGSCRRSDTTEVGPAPDASVVAEVLPRCRAEGPELALGDDVVVGDVAIASQGLLIGLVRNEGSKRFASVLQASLDLATSKVIDVGTAFGDDPPPSPRWNGDRAVVAFLARDSKDGGANANLRELRIAHLDQGAAKVDFAIVQQADESTAFDLAWSDSGNALVAWDEDAPPRADAGPPRETYAPDGRGFVKVQRLGTEVRRVASPESSDAESPRLRARPGGFWLAWLARRAEDEGYEIESPGEKRAFRWVEAVPLNAAGDPAGPVRRVSSEKGRAVTFELEGTGPDLVVFVQDEATSAEAAGARVTRYRVGDRIEAVDVVDGGIGSTVAELVPADKPSSELRWLAWSDTSEHARVTPLSGAFVPAGPSTLEPAFEGGRVLAAGEGTLYAFVAPSAAQAAGSGAAPKIRRFACASKDTRPAQ